MRLRELFKKRPGNMVWMTGSDTRFDRQGNRNDPVNPLPRKCRACGFVDVDRVPQPYALLKARVGSPAELAPGEMGCFFARDRARDVLEAVVPKQLRFFPTVLLGHESEATPWSLVVPVHFVEPFWPKATIPRCPKCSEPRTAHYGSQCEHAKVLEMAFDVARSRQWTSGDEVAEERQAAFARIVYRSMGSSGEKPPKQLAKHLRDRPSPEHLWTRDGVNRILYFSRRLVLLLRELKVKGLTPSVTSDLSPTADDREWVRQQAGRAQADQGRGVVARATKPGGSPDAKRWFAAYLRQHARGTPGKAPDFAEAERRLMVKLPESYKQFVSKVRHRSFEDVLAQEGFTATILPPAKLARLRTSDVRDGEASAGRRGSPESSVVVFATTGHGDCFAFQPATGKARDLVVAHYDHEADELLPFADNFAHCIRRFAGET